MPKKPPSLTCNFYHGEKLELNEHLASSALQDMAQEAHFYLSAPWILREFVWLNCLGTARSKKKGRESTTTSVQFKTVAIDPVNLPKTPPQGPPKKSDEWLAWGTHQLANVSCEHLINPYNTVDGANTSLSTACLTSHRQYMNLSGRYIS